MRLARLVLLSLITASLFASSALAAPPERRARQMRDAGIGLTVTGGAILLTGAAFVVGGAASMSPCNDGQPDCNSAGAFVMVGGAGIGVLSAPFLGVGIPLWVVGDRRLDRASETALYMRPTRDGVGVGLSGAF